MSKGTLGPSGWNIPVRAKKTEGSVEKVNAANKQLVVENNALRKDLENERATVAALTVELEQATGTDMPSRIAVALERFDPQDKSLWTEMGLPKIEAVCLAVEDNTVTRADVEAAIPGFTRQTLSCTPREGRG